MDKCFYNYPKCVPECEYMVEGECKFNELQDLVERIKKVFPNADCYVEDGALNITTSVVANQIDGPVFENATIVSLSPNDGGKAYFYADIFPVEEAPVGPYTASTNGGPWEEIHPIQKWMINPECFIW